MIVAPASGYALDWFQSQQEPRHHVLPVEDTAIASGTWLAWSWNLPKDFPLETRQGRAHIARGETLPR